MTTFRIREVRERVGMSVEELAKLTGPDTWMRRDYLRALEGGCEPSWRDATNIAIALGCSLDELAGLADAPEPGVAWRDTTDVISNP